jgi:hypothetical protein
MLLSGQFEDAYESDHIAGAWLQVVECLSSNHKDPHVEFKPCEFKLVEGIGREGMRRGEEREGERERKEGRKKGRKEGRKGGREGETLGSAYSLPSPAPALLKLSFFLFSLS